MGLLSNIFSGGAEKLISTVGSVVDNLTTSKEEKEAAKLAFQQAIDKHIETMESETTKRMELELKDMDSARNREIAIVTSDKSPLINKIIQPILALLILGSCFLMWYIIMFRDIPKDKEMLIAGIVGSLTTISMSVVSFFFGSSSGSAAKQKQIEGMINTK